MKMIELAVAKLSDIDLEMKIFRAKKLFQMEESAIFRHSVATWRKLPEI